MALMTYSEAKAAIEDKVYSNTDNSVSGDDVAEAINYLSESAMLYKDSRTIQLYAGDGDNELTLGTTTDTGIGAANRNLIRLAVNILVLQGGGTLIVPLGIICVDNAFYMDTLDTGSNGADLANNTAIRAPVLLTSASGTSIYRAADFSGNSAVGTYILSQADTNVVLIRSVRSHLRNICVDAVDDTPRSLGSQIVVGDGAQMVHSYKSSVLQGPEHQNALKVVIENCEIRRGGLCGIQYRDGQNLILINNRISLNWGFAIYAPGGYFDNNHMVSINTFASDNLKGGYYSGDRPYIPYTVNVEDNTLTVPGHTYQTGVRSYAVRTSGTAPTPLVASTPDGAAETLYYIIVVDEDTIKLATSQANANAGTAIDITDEGTGEQYIRYNHYTPNTTTWVGENKFYKNGLEKLEAFFDADTDIVTIPGRMSRTWLTGEKIRFVVTEGNDTVGTMPTGLSAGVEYFAIYVNMDKVRLATTKANAIAGTYIDITGESDGLVRLSGHGCGYEAWGDSHGGGGRIFMEGNWSGLALRGSSDRGCFIIEGDSGNAAPLNLILTNPTKHQITGSVSEFGKINHYHKSLAYEVCGGGPTGGMKFSQTANNNVGFEVTRTTGRSLFSINRGTAAEIGLAINNQSAIYGIGRSLQSGNKRRTLTTADLGTFSAGQSKDFTVTVPYATTANNTFMVGCSNPNKIPPAGIDIPAARCRVTANSGADNAEVTFSVVNTTASDITPGEIYVTISSFNFGSDGWTL